MKKAKVLKKGLKLIEGHREADYGDVHKNFADIAGLWSVVLETKVEPWQVAACMSMSKLARAIKTPTHEDSWVDMAGYVGIAAELATEAVQEPLSEAAEQLEASCLSGRSSGLNVGDTVEGLEAYDAVMVAGVRMEDGLESAGDGLWRYPDEFTEAMHNWSFRRTVVAVP